MRYKNYNEKSKENLTSQPWTNLDGDELAKKRKEISVKSTTVQKQRKKFKQIFDEYLSDTKRENMVKEFCKLVTDPETKVQDKIKVFEIILKIMGECPDEKLTYNEFKELNQTFELKID